MINLADIVAFSDGRYDNVVNAINWANVVVVTIMLSLLVAVLLLIRMSYLRHNSACKVVFALLVVIILCGCGFLVGPSEATINVSPSVADVLKVCYDLDVVCTEDNRLTTNHFVLYDRTADDSTVSTVFIDNCGKPINTVVVLDHNSNVYVIDTDTNKIIQPTVSDSLEVAKLLEEKFQK